MKIKGDNLTIDESENITASIGNIEFNLTLDNSKNGRTKFANGKNKLTVKNGKFSLSMKGDDDTLHSLSKESPLTVKIGNQTCSVDVDVNQVIKY